MKKHITRLLFAALLLLALCIGASAAGTSGKCGPSAYWSFDSSTGTLTISGSGAMNDYEYGNDYPWMDYRDSIQTIGTLFRGRPAARSNSGKTCGVSARGPFSNAET